MAGTSFNDLEYAFFSTGFPSAFISYSSPCLTIGNDVANQLNVCGSAASDPVTITATGSDSAISITITPKGSGAVTVTSALTATGNLHSNGAISSGTSITAGSTLTVTTRTGTPAKFACFDSSGKLVESATACA